MKILIISLLMTCSLSFAQRAKYIETARPGQSIGAEVVGEDVFQVQSGIDRTIVEIGSAESTSMNLNNVIRYGMNEMFEFNANLNINELDSNDTEIGNLQLGGRLNIISKAKKYTPKLAFQTRLEFLDSVGKTYEDLKFVSILSAVWNLNKIGSLTSNLLFNNLNTIEYTFQGYTINWSRSFNRRLSYFAEFYATDSKDEWYKFWDAGVLYLIKNDLAVDASFGMDLEDDFDSQFVSVGFSWRKF